MTRSELLEAMARAIADVHDEYGLSKDMAEAALSAIEQAGLIEQAFKDGLAYGTNVEAADPDLAWQQSRINAMLQSGRLKP